MAIVARCFENHFKQDFISHTALVALSALPVIFQGDKRELQVQEIVCGFQVAQFRKAPARPLLSQPGAPHSVSPLPWVTLCYFTTDALCLLKTAECMS